MFLKGAIRSGTKGRRTAIFGGTMAAILTIPLILWGRSSNPPAGETGLTTVTLTTGPSTCSTGSCHFHGSSAADVTMGVITATNLTGTYTPGGAAIPITVTLGSDTGFGFEMSAVSGSGTTETQAGSFTAGTGSDIDTSTPIQYIRQSSPGSSFSFSWTPPGASVGTVTFNLAGVSSAGIIFANTFTMTPGVTTPPPTTLSATPTPLTFTVNGAEPATQQVTVTSSVPLTGTVTTGVSTSSGGNWLNVMPPGGNTPLTATVGIDATVNGGLGTGTYQGSVSFTNSSASNSPLSVPVTLTVTTPIPPPVVTPPPTLTVNSTGLNFTATVGAAAPSSQPVTVSTSNGSAVTFTDSATTSSGGSWLSVDTAADTTPTSEPISIATVPSTPGTYQGTVTFTSSATSPNSVTLPVTLTVNSPTTTPPPTTGLPWSFNANVVDRLIGGSDYMLLTGNGGMNSTSQLSGSGSFTRFKSLATTTTGNLRGTAAPAAPTSTTPIVANGRWRVTGMTSSNLTTSTTTSSTGVTTTRVTGGTVVLQVSITIQGCNSGGGGGEGEGGTPGTTPSPITGSLTVVSTGGSTSGISLTYQGTCASTSSTGTTTTAVSGSFMSVGIGTYSLGGGGGDN